MLPYLVFLIIYAVSLFFGLIAGAILFNSMDWTWKEMNEDIGDFVPKVRKNARHILLYIGAILLIPLALAFYPYYHAVFSFDFTPSVFEREGCILAGIQNALPSDALTLLLSAVYVFGIVYILFLTPVLVVWRDEFHDGMMKLSYLVLFNVLFALPFFIVIHLTVPSVYDPQTVRPLLYQNPNFHEFITYFGGEGGFHNDFPSHHVSTAFALFIFVCLNRKHRLAGYGIFTGVLAVLTLVSTIYLGIHYIIDVIGGLVLAIIANAAVCLLFSAGKSGKTPKKTTPPKPDRVL